MDEKNWLFLLDQYILAVKHYKMSAQEAFKLLSEERLAFLSGKSFESLRSLQVDSEEVSSLNTSSFEEYCRNPDNFIIDYETGNLTKVK